MVFLKSRASQRVTKATAAGAITVAALAACTTETTKTPTKSSLPQKSPSDSSQAPTTHSSGPLFSRSQTDADWKTAFYTWQLTHETYKTVKTPDGKGGAFIGANGDVFPWGSLGSALSAGNPLGANLISVPDSADASKVSKSKLSTANYVEAKAIGNTAQATWLGYWVNQQPEYIANIAATAETNGEVPLFVFYAVADSENSSNADMSYDKWLDNLIGQIAKQHSIAAPVVIIEPNTLPFAASDPTSPASKTKLAKVHSAIGKLKAAGIKGYVDIGGANWLTPALAAKTLIAAGIKDAAGFSLNVSNYTSTQTSIAYAEQVNASLVAEGAKPAHYVIDTGRNGNQINVANSSQPFNLKGASYGDSPTTAVSTNLLDADLWIKNPLQSDQNTAAGQYASAQSVACPPAGQFCQPFTEDLVLNHHESTGPTGYLAKNNKSLLLVWPDGGLRFYGADVSKFDLTVPANLKDAKVSKVKLVPDSSGDISEFAVTLTASGKTTNLLYKPGEAPTPISSSMELSLN